MKKKSYARYFGIFGCCLLTVFSSVSQAAADEEVLQLSLERCIEKALAHNYMIEAAEHDSEAARWQLRSAKRSAGAVISWGSQAYRLGGEDYRGASFDRTFTNRLTLEIPLYTGGQIEGNVKNARYQVNAADFGVEGARQRVRYQAVEAYYNLLQRKNLLQVAESAVHMASEQTRLLTIQFEEGTVARSDVIQMEVQRADYEQNLIRARGNLRIAEAELRSLLGLTEEAKIDTVDTFSYEPYTMELSDCVGYARKHRPDLLAAIYQIKQAEARQGIAGHGYRPKVSGTLRKTIVGTGAFQKDRNASWQYGMELKWDIFDNQITAAKIKAAAQLREKAQAEAEEVSRKAVLDVRKAYTQLRTAESKMQSAKEVVKQAEMNNTLAEVRFKEGVDIILKVTDAQEKLTQARTNYYTSLYEYNLGRALLNQAMGIPVGMDAQKYYEEALAGKSPNEARRVATLP